MKLARHLVPFWSRPQAPESDPAPSRVAGPEPPTPLRDHQATAIDAIIERLNALDREVAKLGRQQFEATTLLEGQSEDLDDLVRSWRELLVQRQREADELRQALAAMDRQVRLSLVNDLLPVADALAESVCVAQELVSQRKAGQVDGNPKPRGWRWPWQQAQPLDAKPPPAALEGWLDGLRLVERRLLALLEREGVRPIPAIGLPFDPQQHLAVAVDHGGTGREGTVIAETRRGYVCGDRVLRHAEVVVAQGPDGADSLTASAVGEAK